MPAFFVWRWAFFKKKSHRAPADAAAAALLPHINHLYCFCHCHSSRYYC
jgi:hypothetical protein